MFGEVQEQEDREGRGGGQDKGGRDKIKNIKNQFYNLISSRRDATNEICRRYSMCTLPRSLIIHQKLHE